MAFCPNCGTPNTDEADKCVSCGFELAPKQKPKFKGTMMMSPGQALKLPARSAPSDQGPQGRLAGAPPAASAQPEQPTKGSAPAGKNMAFAKTMLGPAAGLGAPAPPASTGPAPAGGSAGKAPTSRDEEPRAAPGSAWSHAPTIQGAAGLGAATTDPSPPRTTSPDANALPSASQLGPSPAAGGWRGGGFADSSVPPVPKSNTGKILAIGCAATLVLSCVIGTALYMVAKRKVESLLSEADTGVQTEEWSATLSQSLAQVAGLCQDDCSRAAVYFHPQAQAALAEAAQLTPARAQRLATQGEAAMLSDTDDGAALAGQLGLDATRCVQLALEGTKAVGCSVPEPGGDASLRIIHLSGLKGL